MKKIIRLLFPVLLLLALASIVMAQGDGPPSTSASFALVNEIGHSLPQGVQYDPVFDRFALVDPQGRLLLVDAATFEVQQVLYETGTYSTYQFSHNGLWLALAIDRRVEIWNTATGALDVAVDVEESLYLQAPLQFSDDDNLLLINAVVPAPAALRRSENDTANLPFLWDLPAARNEALTTLPQSFELYSFYDYRNGFLLGPHRKVLAALPQRFRLIDVADTTLPVLTEVASDRNERDPISVWYSLRGEQMYVLPQGSGDLVQLNTTTGQPLTIPLSRDLGPAQMRNLDALVLSDQSRLIGEPNSRGTNSFLRLLLGEDYRLAWNYHPLTVMLLDILNPVTAQAGQMGLLVYIRDEDTGYGTIEFVYPPDALQIALDPDNTHLAVRRSSGVIEIYDLATGILELTIPAAPDNDYLPHLLAYNSTGDALVANFQRFDPRTGALLFEDPNYTTPGFDYYFFTEDSQTLVTLSGSNWWQWDIQTGEVIRREKVNLQGTLLQTSPDAHRFLTQLDTASDPTMEVVDIGSEVRNTVTFQRLPNREIEQIIPSPNWENFLVVYTSNSYGPHYPGNEIAIYNLYDGQRWFFAGDDLPYPEGRYYGWLDDETVYVYSENLGGSSQPTRIYGLDYDPSGLPACLVEAFPAEWTQWIDLWEQLNAHLRSDALGRLTQKLCAALPGTVDEVNTIFYPSPTPTLPPMTATPVAIAGVPACLTARFPDEAQAYAALWRQISVGMTPEQLAELETLLCEGLYDASLLDSYQTEAVNQNVQVMTIDVNTGLRSSGGFVPSRETPPARSLDLVLQELQRTLRLRPTEALLSPDGTLLAARIAYNRLQIYKLVTSYDTLAANATATAAPQTEGPNYIAVQPTATHPFDVQGGPRPTMTPTVTPTSPPRPDRVVAQPDYDATHVFAPVDPRYVVSSPPPNYEPSGYLLVNNYLDNRLWVLDPSTGETWPEDRLPDCLNNYSCTFSFDQNWMYWAKDGDLVLSRADGSNLQVLYDEEEYAVWPAEIFWRGLHTLEYHFLSYLPDKYRDPVSLTQQIDPAAPTTPAPFEPPDRFSVNELSTEYVSSRPDGDPVFVLRTSFNTGSGFGYKYYVYDYIAGTVDYFARLTEGELSLEWHPKGTALYYRYPDADDWYIYDPATREHRLLGELPGGIWSRDGRYRVSWYVPSGEEYRAYIKTGTPLPKLSVWDSETGLIRRYAVPDTADAMFDSVLYWSPDSRYLAFNLTLPADMQYEVFRPRTLVLDTQTGTVTELSMDVSQILLWIDHVPERGK